MCHPILQLRPCDKTKPEYKEKFRKRKGKRDNFEISHSVFHFQRGKTKQKKRSALINQMENVSQGKKETRVNCNDVDTSLNEGDLTSRAEGTTQYSFLAFFPRSP